MHDTQVRKDPLSTVHDSQVGKDQLSLEALRLAALRMEQVSLDDMQSPPTKVVVPTTSLETDSEVPLPQPAPPAPAAPQPERERIWPSRKAKQRHHYRQLSMDHSRESIVSSLSPVEEGDVCDKSSDD